MLLKRKRSDDELASFSSSRATGCSSPLNVADPTCRSRDYDDVVMMDMESPVSPHISAFSPRVHNQGRSCTPSHLPSRTFKRLRNGRPSDQEVQRTPTFLRDFGNSKLVLSALANPSTISQRKRSICYTKPRNTPNHTTFSLPPSRPLGCPRCHLRRPK